MSRAVTLDLDLAEFQRQYGSSLRIDDSCFGSLADNGKMLGGKRCLPGHKAGKHGQKQFFYFFHDIASSCSKLFSLPLYYGPAKSYHMPLQGQIRQEACSARRHASALFGQHPDHCHDAGRTGHFRRSHVIAHEKDGNCIRRKRFKSGQRSCFRSRDVFCALQID